MAGFLFTNNHQIRDSADTLIERIYPIISHYQPFT